MFCCSRSTYPQEILNIDPDKAISKLENKARDARITAIVLSMITLFLFAAAFTLYGVGTLSPTALMGLGMFPYLGGVLINFVGLGVLCGSVLFATIYGIRNCQKESWEELLAKSGSD